jgi:hypothetical protein
MRKRRNLESNAATDQEVPVRLVSGEVSDPFGVTEVSERFEGRREETAEFRSIEVNPRHP